jgi:hypothetical protein
VTTARVLKTARRSARSRQKKIAAVTTAIGGCNHLGRRGIVPKTILSESGE